MATSSYSPSTAELASALERMVNTVPEPSAVDQDATDAPHRPRYAAVTPELNVVPLVDILFLLMVFFVIAGVFGLAEGILSSSNTKGGSTPGGVPLPFSPIIVELTRTAAQRCTIRVRPESAQAIHSPGELAVELRRILSLPGFGPDTTVVLRAADNVLWDDVATAWNAAVFAGFSDVVFGRPPGAG